MAEKPWGGRFTAPTDKFVEEFTQSVSFDKRLYKYDIAGSMAHCRMLAKQGIISSADATQIMSGLGKVLADIESGAFDWKTSLEDVHMNIESTLTGMVGDAGKRLHTARSRNDQVALDIRLYLRDEINLITREIYAFQEVLLARSEEYIDVILPGYTHLQRAQPVIFSHHLMAYFEMLERDASRFFDCYRRGNRCPLGAGAMAGTGYPIDRRFVSTMLGFDSPTANSIDSVSDRDFNLEFLADCAILMMHLSRLSEELVIWSSFEFGFVDLPDSYCTGSSIMPQKKNPDVPELVRGKTGRVYGDLFALLTVMKGLPLAYNKDMQEDKEPTFDAADTVKYCLRACKEIVAGLKPRANRMQEAARGGYTTATDLADWLVRKGLPFREAHEVVGKVVRMLVDAGREMEDLTLDELKAFYPDADASGLEVLKLAYSVNSRNHYGGTAKQAILDNIAIIKELRAKTEPA